MEHQAKLCGLNCIGGGKLCKGLEQKRLRGPRVCWMNGGSLASEETHAGALKARPAQHMWERSGGYEFREHSRGGFDTT